MNKWFHISVLSVAFVVANFTAAFGNPPDKTLTKAFGNEKYCVTIIPATSPICVGTQAYISVSVDGVDTDGALPETVTTKQLYDNSNPISEGLYTFSTLGQHVFTAIVVVSRSDGQTRHVDPASSACTPTINVVPAVDHVVLTAVPNGDVVNGTQVVYTAKAYDASNNDITSQAELHWHQRYTPVDSSSEVDVDLGTGSTKTIKWTIKTIAQYIDSTACSAPAMLGSVDVQAKGCSPAPVDTSIVLVSKGTLTNTLDHDVVIGDVPGDWQETNVDVHFVCDKCTPGIPPGTCNENLSGTTSHSGSVSVTGSAKGKCEPFGIGVEVTVGVTGAYTYTNTKTVTIGGSQPCSPKCDILFRFYDRWQTETKDWNSLSTKTYDSGYVENCITGTGHGQGENAQTHLVYVPQNCNP